MHKRRRRLCLTGARAALRPAVSEQPDGKSVVVTKHEPHEGLHVTAKIGHISKGVFHRRETG